MFLFQFWLARLLRQMHRCSCSCGNSSFPGGRPKFVLFGCRACTSVRSRSFFVHLRPFTMEIVCPILRSGAPPVLVVQFFVFVCRRGKIFLIPIIVVPHRYCCSSCDLQRLLFIIDLFVCINIYIFL